MYIIECNECVFIMYHIFVMYDEPIFCDVFRSVMNLAYVRTYVTPLHVVFSSDLTFKLFGLKCVIIISGRTIADLKEFGENFKVSHMKYTG